MKNGHIINFLLNTISYFFNFCYPIMKTYPLSDYEPGMKLRFFRDIVLSRFSIKPVLHFETFVTYENSILFIMKT